MNDMKEYPYYDAGPTHSSSYLWPVVRREIEALGIPETARRAFDLGCGNGATVGQLAGLGFNAIGVDPSESGIAMARAAYRTARFEVASAYEDLQKRFGRFPLVISLEVVEHLYDPRRFARNLFELVEPGGAAIVSTPYHGYVKNLALALSGKMDHHFGALWDGGHIKFFSESTLTELLQEAGFTQISFRRAGRISPLAKSMVAIARRV